jgi:protein phosphatase
MLTVETRTHPGRVRDTNEDAVLWDPGLGLIAVADGMGGHSAGEVAARLAIETLHDSVKSMAASEKAPWPFGVDPRLSVTANRLTTAVKLANRRIFTESESRPDYAGMGTTLVVALADGARLTFSSVGDSRIYAWRDGSLRQLTRDDSWVTVLSEEAGSDPAAFKGHPLRNVLTKVVGTLPEIEVDAHEIDLHDGHVIVLCSDGLYAGLPDGALERTLDAEEDLSAAADRLVQAALDADGRDNISVLLARYSRT